MATTHLFAMLLCATFGADLPADFQLSPPPGALERAGADAPTFAAGAPLVATSYFYWYDAETKFHVVDPDGTDALTDHPPTLDGFSYNNADWHAQQLADMAAAGIDVALPVYWGVPYVEKTWSDEGLPPMVAARERLLRQGKQAPRLGMFYDTSTLQYNSRNYRVDLTTPAGRLWFYGTIRNFFSLIPARHRACIDGKPLVLLYSAHFAKQVDAELIPAVRRMFRDDFGTDLYVVKMRDWPGEADSEYQWGGAIAPQIHDTAAIGPGYDHSAVPGRAPLVRPRDDGRFYQFGWTRLLAMDPARRPWLLHLETWNELHEGTDICETVEYGRKYIELTRRYARKFHDRRRIDPAEGMPRLEQVAASPEKSEGLKLVPLPDGDGPVVDGTVAGRQAWSTKENRHSPVTRYLYFDVDYAFLYDGDEPVEVTVGYFDDGPDGFRLQYDSSDPELSGVGQQFREGPVQPIQGSKTWKEARFVVPHARFAGRANGCDFRLACSNADLVVGHVSIRRAEK
ncbi:MAG: DUF5010 domain-containing protein [Pirellulales bacterium]|nr:DUF5010 domain-containing protein [Pirellulales bacterium]